MTQEKRDKGTRDDGSGKKPRDGNEGQGNKR
jgi:hypothetical protein